MKPLYKQTATWEGYEEALAGQREPASIDMLLDWLIQLAKLKAATNDITEKMNLELERQATHRILDILTNGN